MYGFECLCAPTWWIVETWEQCPRAQDSQAVLWCAVVCQADRTDDLSYLLFINSIMVTLIEHTTIFQLAAECCRRLTTAGEVEAPEWVCDFSP